MRSKSLTQSAFVFLRLAWLRTSKLAVTFTNRLKSPLLRSRRLLMRSLLLAKRFMASGISFLRSLESFFKLQAEVDRQLKQSQNPRLQSLLQSLRKLSTLLLMKLKSRLTSLRTLLSSSNFRSNLRHTFEKKKKSQEQSMTQIKTTWRRL